MQWLVKYLYFLEFPYCYADSSSRTESRFGVHNFYTSTFYRRCFEKTSRHSFVALFVCINLSRYTETEGTERRSSLVSRFMEFMKLRRRSRVSPSEIIYIDENISRWYVMEGKFMPEGLPYYVSMDNKPESGCEIKIA